MRTVHAPVSTNLSDLLAFVNELTFLHDYSAQMCVEGVDNKKDAFVIIGVAHDDDISPTAWSISGKNNNSRPDRVNRCT